MKCRQAVSRKTSVRVIIDFWLISTLDKSLYSHEEYVYHTAHSKLLDKVESIKSSGDHADIIIVGDTIISFGDEVIEKAKDEQDAIE